MFPTLGTEESSSLDCTLFASTSFPSLLSVVISFSDCISFALALFLSSLLVVCSAGRAVWALLSSLPCNGVVIKVGAGEEERDDAIGERGIRDGNVVGGGTESWPNREWGIVFMMPP